MVLVYFWNFKCDSELPELVRERLDSRFKKNSEPYTIECPKIKEYIESRSVSVTERKHYTSPTSG